MEMMVMKLPTPFRIDHELDSLKLTVFIALVK